MGSDHIRQPRGGIRCSGEVQHHALVGDEAEGHLPVRHGEPAHHIGRLDGFRTLRPQEFEPRGHRIEEISHFHFRAFAEGGRPHILLAPAFYADHVSFPGTARA